MNPQDLTVLRVIALYVQQLEAANMQLQAQLAERDRRIAELEAKHAEPAGNTGL